MDITKATTEPFYQFYQFHIGVNRTVKIAGASLAAVERLAAGNGGDRMLEMLIEIAAPYWGTSHRWKNRAVLIERARVEISCALAVTVFSAFANFLVASSALLHRESAHGQNAVKLGVGTIKCEKDDSNPLSRFVQLHGYDLDCPPALLAALHFLWVMRCCIVHANCRIGPAGLGLLADETIATALIACGPKQNERIHDMLRKSRESLSVHFEPWSPIFLSDICRMAAAAVDRETVKRVGFVGLARMAAGLLEDGLTNSKVVPRPQPKSFHLTMKHLLVSRFRVSNVTERLITQAIANDGKTIDLKTRYNTDCERYLASRRAAIVGRRRQK